MHHHRLLPVFAALVTLALSVPATAYDADDMARDARLLGKTKISLLEAIRIAEEHKSGKGFTASLDDYDGTPVYSVTVIQGDKTYDVEIDGFTGEIASPEEEFDSVIIENDAEQDVPAAAE